MQTETKAITIDKEKHEVELREYESLEELMVSESAEVILELFNYRSKQLQVCEWKKKLKPRRIPVKEKRMLAFNLFSSEELGFRDFLIKLIC